MNGLERNRPPCPVSFTNKQERVRFGKVKGNGIKHIDPHCTVYSLLLMMPTIGEDDS